jgi:peptidoglycan/LPS O-acetylase OafA/YrhL
MSTAYRADVDGLRALAVGGVVVFHAFPALLPGGFIGVDIFFVLSGFLISNIIFSGLDEGNFSFKTFYARRVKRIFPALSLVLALSAVLGWLLLFPEEFFQLGKHLAAAAAYASNFVLWREAGYFDSAGETKPLLHLWSLAVEEQFYLFWPLLVKVVWPSRRAAVALTLGVLMLTFALNVYFVHSKPEATFYLPVTRLWELLCGSSLALWQCTVGRSKAANSSSIKRLMALLQKPKFANALSATGLGLILLAFALIDKTKAFPGWWALLPTIGTVLVIAAGPRAWLNHVLLSHPAAVWLGLISYPLYLWHWPLLSFARVVEAGPPPAPILLMAVTASVFLAWCTYKWIELPVRRGLAGVPIVGVLCALLVSIGCVGLWVAKADGMPERFSAENRRDLATMLRGDISSPACQAIYGKQIGTNYCLMAGTGPKKIFVIGDSHAQALFSGYADGLAKQGFSVLLLSQSSCPFIARTDKPNVTDPRLGMLDRAQCAEKMKRILALAIAENASAVLYANGGWDYARDEFVSGLASTLLPLAGRVPVYYFLQQPIPPFGPRSCISRWSHALGDCRFIADTATLDRSAYQAAVKSATAAIPNLQILDTQAAVCTGKNCVALDDGGFLYAEDGVHLSAFGGRYVAARLPLRPAQDPPKTLLH